MNILSEITFFLISISIIITIIISGFSWHTPSEEVCRLSSHTTNYKLQRWVTRLLFRTWNSPTWWDPMSLHSRRLYVLHFSSLPPPLHYLLHSLALVTTPTLVLSSRPIREGFARLDPPLRWIPNSLCRFLHKKNLSIEVPQRGCFYGSKEIFKVEKIRKNRTRSILNLRNRRSF